MSTRLGLFALAALIVASVLVAACGSADGTATTTPANEENGALAGGLLATFQVDDERFRVWITNPATIRQILDLQAGTSTAAIPSGLILDGPGTGDHNAPWTWHLDPHDIEMADVTIELCDARPSYVEENKREFIDVIMRYCAWGAELTEIADYR